MEGCFVRGFAVKVLKRHVEQLSGTSARPVFLCDLRDTFAILAVKSFCVSPAMISAGSNKIVTAKNAKGTRRTRREAGFADGLRKESSVERAG
jgi:hypothetical protein